MFKLLGILLVVGIIVLLTGFALVLSVIHSLFRPKGNYPGGSGRQRKKAAGPAYGTQRQDRGQGYAKTEDGDIRINRKKLFTKDDGEYVDYEEVKD